MLEAVDDASETFLPYRNHWELSDVRRYFARQPVPLSVSPLAERVDGTLDWREMTLAIGRGLRAMATLVIPRSTAVTRGVVLARACVSLQLLLAQFCWASVVSRSCKLRPMCAVAIWA